MEDELAHSKILVCASGNLLVSKFLARLQYGHQVLEKTTIVLSEMEFCRSRVINGYPR